VISVVTFKWKPYTGYRSLFGADQVNVMRSMIARHYPDPHRFICVTDDAQGIDPRIDVVPLWDDHADIPNPSFRGGPSCYRRLKVFSRDIGAVLGERFVCIDLDAVITGDLRPLFNRTDPFIGWRNPNPLWPLNGSLFMLTAGARPQVWETFDPLTSPAISHAAGCRGSDQGWMSYILGRNEPTWGPEDGVYSFQDELVGRSIKPRRPPVPPYKLPSAARAVMFHGATDPWTPQARKVAPWVKEHYQ
jgi:hypothetical protein